MIFDTLDQAGVYGGIAQGIAEGLRFLRAVTAETAVGRYPLEGGCYANVDRYCTRRVNENGLEAHRQYIDIQYLVTGEERILVQPLAGLECTQAYDEGRDVAFYRHTDSPAADLRLGDGRFVILFPEDAHEPQLCVGSPTEVLKVVVKVPVGSTLSKSKTS